MDSQTSTYMDHRYGSEPKSLPPHKRGGPKGLLLLVVRQRLVFPRKTPIKQTGYCLKSSSSCPLRMGVQADLFAASGHPRLVHPARLAYPPQHDEPEWRQMDGQKPIDHIARNMDDLHGCASSIEPNMNVNTRWVAGQVSLVVETLLIGVDRHLRSTPPVVARRLGDQVPSAAAISALHGEAVRMPKETAEQPRHVN